MKLERLVIGVDFSTHAVEAARWATNQLAPRAEVVLAHVIPHPEPRPIVRRGDPRRDPLIDTVRDGAEKRLREISRSLNADFVWREIREGNPVESLARVAAEFSADLVVAGVHGERPDVGEALGSTAEHLVRTSPRPVLLVAHPRLTPPSHLLVVVDQPEDAAGAMRFAGVVSRRFRARITPMHVATSGVARGVLATSAGVSGSPPVVRRAWDPTADMSDRWVDGAVAAGSNHERATSEVSPGQPTREVLSAAERLGADLIVIGRRGEGDSLRAALGSVADGVLRGPTCPVIVVPEH